MIITIKLLDCGRHRCVRLCHMGDCGSCLQSVEKHCRCGQKKKSVLCSQDFLCDSRCQRIRQCGRHQCRKKVNKCVEVCLLLLVAFCSVVLVIVHHVNSYVVDFCLAKLTNVHPLVILVRL